VNRLFIRLYLDEDVDVLIARLCRARGFDASTTIGAGHLRSTDEAQLAYAASEGRAMLTHNRNDFEELGATWRTAGRTHAGIIIAVRRPPHEIARRLFLLLNHLAAEEIVDQIYYI
jgi:hypothetical protein